MNKIKILTYLILSNFPKPSLLFFNQWRSISLNNSNIFEEVFKQAPNDMIENFAQLAEYAENRERLIDTDPEAAMEKLDEIKGVLMDYPLKFLHEEWFHPSTFEGLNAEKLVFGLGTFT